MKILVLGGTGPMGEHLSRILDMEGHEVHVTSRSNRSAQNSVNCIHGNAKDLIFLYSLLKSRWDVIVDFMVYSNLEFEERIEKLLSASSQYFYLSSARVYDNSQEYITEKCTRLLDTCNDAHYMATDEYALTKARQEDMLESLSLRNWIIIRPYITYSEARLQLGTLEKESWLYRALKGRTIVFCEELKDKFTSMTYGLDVARSMVKIMTKKNSMGQSYHITSSCAYKWSEILELYLNIIEEETGKRPKVLFQSLSDFVAWSPVKYPIIYDRMYDRKFDNSKIDNIFSTEDFIDPKEGLRQCLKEFLKNPHYRNISWRREATKDALCDEYTPFSEIHSVKSKLIYLAFRYIPLIRGF